MHVIEARKSGTRRPKARTNRWLAALALLVGLGLPGASGAAARADTGGAGGFWIATHIELSGSVFQGGSPYAPPDWTPPKCWLELNSGYGIDPAYTPDGFALYMAQTYAFYDHAQETAIKQAFYDLYYSGKGVDPAVGLTAPPYNEGVGGGKWYAIACTPDAGYGDYVAVQASLGVSNQYEEWFWLADGKPPAGVPVMDPNLLAEYAAANTRVVPGWPVFSPKLDNQTVNLATLVTNPPGANGFKTYTARATLPATGQFSEVHASVDSVTFTASPAGVMSPSSVTCGFNADGSLQSGCQFTFLKATSTGYTLTESTMWKVTWDGDPFTGEPGWTKQIGPITQSKPVLVQEIQTIVGH